MAMILGSVVRPLETPYHFRRRSKAFSLLCKVDMFFLGAKNKLTISRGWSTHKALSTSSRRSLQELSSISLRI